MNSIAVNRALLSWSLVITLVCWLALPTRRAQAAEQRQFQIGVAKVDVTPTEPIRLTGYAGRKTNSIGVEQKLWAKALAIGTDREGPALLMTLDNCGIAEETYRELVRRLQKLGIKQERLTICLSHTHSGPCTTRWAPNIFAQDIPAEHQAAIDRYTRDLIDKIEQAARAALKDRRPGKLSWSQGGVGFARNRRTIVGNTAKFGDNAGGPVDHALPVIKAEDSDGKLRALAANYACHCTTLGGEFNHVCGDWAGYAQEYLERDHPEAVALITIGCGADANPYPRGGADAGLALAKKHGEEIAAEVKRLLTQNFTPLSSKLTTGLKEIELPFAVHFTREQWEARSKEGGIVGYHSKKWLARLDSGQKLPASLYYPVGAWTFGDELALVFLPGEVVVDYALRLKKDFDDLRLWVTGYANYVPCYIPSRRILAEGGYEAEESLWYYDRPARISTNAEELIIKTVHELLPKTFLLDKRRAEFPPPKTPQQALATFRTKAEFTVELVASEPLIESPVAIDWGPDGRLWVCEMFDYPSGLDGKFKPGGRIKVLQSTKRDGHYDRATLFLDGLPFPTGIMPWRKGALICAAPNILYAEDTDGDGKADIVRTNFTGFATHNFQARVNGFTWGLDGWLHGSSGLFGGKIKSLLTGKEVDLSGRDFRLKPDTGEIEPVAGLSQMGRVRDDFENWFGNDNGTLLWHYPLPDHYLRRNPHVTYPEPRVNVARNADANKLFPISRTLERFNDPQMANRVTSACGPEIYRDDLLGTNYYGNAFICEPVHNLVTRLVLERDGVTFTAHRAPDEQRSEFLASTDNWFRPVQVRTGPDGALWIVDMYRFVVEHPRWIPTNRLAQLDVRAGADMGRIYRVYPRGTEPGPIQNLAQFAEDKLLETLNATNGPTRDLAHRKLVEQWLQPPSAPKGDSASQRPEGRAPRSRLAIIATNSSIPAARVQALHVLSHLGLLEPELLQRALTDAYPAVRQQAVRLCEPFLVAADRGHPSDLTGALLKLARDPEPRVGCQVAMTLGEWNHSQAADALADIAVLARGNAYLRAATLSSAARHPERVAQTILSSDSNVPQRNEIVGQLMRTAIRTTNRVAITKIWTQLNSAPKSESLRMQALAQLLEWYESRGGFKELQRELRLEPAVESQLGRARVVAQDSTADERMRINALRLLPYDHRDWMGSMAIVHKLLLSSESSAIQEAALKSLAGWDLPEVSTVFLENWRQYPPALRSKVVEVLLSRNSWTRGLLGSLQEGKIAVAEIGPSVRQRLLMHKDESIRKEAESAFATTTSLRRGEVLANYQSVVSLTGRLEHGDEVFEKNCAQCHAFRGRGHQVGANLGEFAGKSAEDFVVAIFDPNAAINPNFIAYNIETKDGRSLSGIVKGETASSLTLVQGGGVEEKILRGDIKEIRASQLSLMPEGLEQSMMPQDVADLIAWLKSSGPKPFGSASAEQAAKARAEFIQTGFNGLAALQKSGAELSYASWLGRLPMAYCRQDGGMNRLIWKTAPVPKQLPADATCIFRLPAAMGFVSQPSGKFTLRLNSQPALEFNVALSDQTWQNTDGRVRMTYTVMENSAEDSNGVLLIEAHASLLKPGEPAQFEVIGSGARSQRWFGIYLLPNQANVQASEAASRR